MNNRTIAISIIVIGLNSAKTLESCLLSIKNMDVPEEAILKNIIYVDGGSTDRSAQIAKAVDGVKIIELSSEKATPGKQRNIGWRAAEGEWINFFDSDTEVDKNWLREAINNIDNGIGAIFGQRKEKYPNKNWFHFIADLEWVKPVSDAKYFGGDVMIRRNVLEESGGYDESLIAGEDPELSARIRSMGYSIKGLDKIMCYHDINMDNFKQYFKRSARSGYGYASAGLKMLKNNENAWFLKMLKLLCKGFLVLFFISISFLSTFRAGVLFAIIVIFLPFSKVGFFQKNFKITFKQSCIYASHCSVVTFLQLFGVLRYFLEKFLLMRKVGNIF